MISRFVRKLRPIGNIEKATALRITGWAAGRTPITVEAWIGSRCVVKTNPGEIRKDVAAAFPTFASAVKSGFSLDLPAGFVESGTITQLRLLARSSFPFFPSRVLGTVHFADPDLAQSLAQPRTSGLTSPFPRMITDAIAAYWPEDCAALDTAAGQRRFVTRLKQLFAAPETNSLPFVAHYARYLSSTLAHCRFVEKHFPTTNLQANPGAPDFYCKPNSIYELFPIIHQLYVLRSYDVEGDFLEAGCFKGYSSAMLSFACQQLGITMHILDSFAGLPNCHESGYERGQYFGSLDEVINNISHFGSINCVELHKGFFADTLRDWSPPKLMCLWMDVDLASSATDLMALADRVNERATIFSHECVADTFFDGAINSAPAPDNPVAPLIQRFADLERPLTGRHVSGFTGAFWSVSDGIPTVDCAILFDLAHSI